MKINVKNLRYILLAVLSAATTYAQQYQSLDFLSTESQAAPAPNNSVVMNVEEAMQNEAFKTVKESLSPLSIDQIDELKVVQIS